MQPQERQISASSTSTAADDQQQAAVGHLRAERCRVTCRVHSGRGNGRASAPQIACSSATPASDSPTVTSTCSMVRRYSGRIRTSSTSDRDQRAGGHPEGDREHEAQPVRSRRPAGCPPPTRCAYAPTARNSAVREVEHVGQPEDQRQAGGDQEVQRRQAEPGQRQQDRRCSSVRSTSRGAGADARAATSVSVGRPTSSSCGRRRSRRPRPAASTTASGRAGGPRPGSARPAAPAPLGDPFQHLGDLGDHLRRQPLGRLVDEQQPVAVEQHPADRDHLLLPAGQRAGPLPSAPVQLREQRVDRVVRRACVPRRSASRRFSATVSPANTPRSSGT